MKAFNTVKRTVITVSALIVLGAVGCSKDNKENKTNYGSQARTAYNTCMQRMGYYDPNYCGQVRGNQTCSLNDYLGNACGYTAGSQVNYGGYYYGQQQGYNPAMLDSYFNTYLAQRPQQDVQYMINQWSSNGGGYGGYYPNQQYPGYGYPNQQQQYYYQQPYQYPSYGYGNTYYY